MAMLRFSSPTILVSLLLSSCLSSEASEGETGEDGAADEQCLSGVKWVGGNRESTHMNPGQDCLACHANLGEAEEVRLAGTVYDGTDEPNDCYGVEGVTIQITDSTNKVTELTSNAAGNFVLESENGSITPPYSAKLIYEGRERMMGAMQTELSCNSCHTETGANGAPGRILAP
jgi:hypothetical protein